jgi:hypothetical protein
MNPIAAAIAPLKQGAQDHAEQFARRQCDRMLAKLEEDGWDAQKSYPYPSSRRMDRIAYIFAAEDYKLSRRITKSTLQFCRAHGAPDPRVIDEAGIEQYVQEVRKEAGLSFEAYVAKLCRKVGTVDEASICGNALWASSILTVRKGDKTEQWKTQQIVNISKLGRPYNQWPTRQLKTK